MKCVHSPVNAYASTAVPASQHYMTHTERNGFHRATLTLDFANENHLHLNDAFDMLSTAAEPGITKMIEPRRAGDLLFHTVARVLTYVAFAAIGAAAVFIFVMVLEHH